MIDLSRFFLPLFMDEKISKQELRAFTDDFLKKLTVQNTGGVYSEMLNVTIAAYEVFFGAIADLDVRAAIQKSRTASMNLVMDAFKASMQSSGLVIEGLLTNKPQLQEFFPLGRSEFSQITLEKAETLMKRLASASATHRTAIGDTIAKEFEAYPERFKEARGVQLAEIAKVSDMRQEAKDARLALATLMTKNVLQIAMNNIGNPDAAKLFFNQSLLEDKGSSAVEDTPPAPPSVS